MPNVVELAEQFHAALDRDDVAAMERIAAAYRGVIDRLDGDISALELEIAQMQKPTAGRVQRLRRYKILLTQAKTELDKFEGYMDLELNALAKSMVARGLAESEALLLNALGDDPALKAAFNRLPVEAVEQLVGFLDPAGSLYQNLHKLSEYTTDLLAQTIINHVALGKNPRVLAQALTESFGMGLTSALTTARTVQLYSYRYASHANYLNNADVVTSYVWYAKLDSSTCMSCTALHGQVFELSEKPSSHHNCRCVMIPITILDEASPVEQTGQQWFESLPEADQRAMMGPGKYQAWKDGKFDFPALSTTHTDAVYGPMKGEATLKELTGGK